MVKPLTDVLSRWTSSLTKSRAPHCYRRA